MEDTPERIHVVMALPSHAGILAQWCLNLITESGEEFPLLDNALEALTTQIMEDMQTGVENLNYPADGVELWLLALSPEGVPIGGLQYQVGTPPAPYSGVFAYAGKLYVEPEYRGGEVGTLIIKKALALAKSHGATYGVVKASSRRLMQRYARLFGFVPADREMFVKL